MGMSEREYHIKVLENLLSHYKAREQCEGYYDSTLKDNVEALEYAISSIKTNEAYQIMYEGGEIFTKDDTVAMLDDIQLEIEKNSYPLVDDIVVNIANKAIQKKINALKENKDEKCN